VGAVHCICPTRGSERERIKVATGGVYTATGLPKLLCLAEEHTCGSLGLCGVIGVMRSFTIYCAGVTWFFCTLHPPRVVASGTH